VELRKQFRPFLFYLPDFDVGNWQTDLTTPISTGPLLMPEEIPIFIAAFHLSSVARYKPLFLQQLFESRLSPLVLGMQRYVLLKFLILTWSFVHNKCLFMNSG